MSKEDLMSEMTESWVCDVCSNLKDATDYKYCRACMQRLCRSCQKVHKYITASKDHTFESCLQETEILEKSFQQVMIDTFGSLHDAATWTLSELGIPVCVNYKLNTFCLCADSYEILELAIRTLCLAVLDEDKSVSEVKMIVRHGRTEWIFRNSTASIVRNLYKDEIYQLYGLFPSVRVIPVYTESRPTRLVGLSRHNVNMNNTKTGKSGTSLLKRTTTDKETEATSRICFGSQFTNTITDEGDTSEGASRDNKDEIDNLSVDQIELKPKEDLDTTIPEKTVQMLAIQCSLDDYLGVKEIIRDIENSIKNLYKVEISRPKKDTFRVNIYVMLKESSEDVYCSCEHLESGVIRLIIRGKDQDKVLQTKTEFLSLFCKECSVCRVESSKPTYLECKHLLCQKCVHQSTSLNNGLLCQVCEGHDSCRSTPVPSLQVHCLNSLDELFVADEENDDSVNPGSEMGKFIPDNNEGIPEKVDGKQIGNPKLEKILNSRRQKRTVNSGNIHRLTVKVPKYLLQKWSKRPGGLMKLKSVIENELGFQTEGPLDNLAITGKNRELLDLAVYSLEAQNEAGSEHEVRRRIVDKAVQWRFKGNFAKIVNSLFHTELYELARKHKTVTLSVFTKYNPATVDVKCAFKEYEEMKYKVDVLESQIKGLYEDESIQPKTFYYSVKVKDFVYRNENNEHVFCTLSERKNLYVITFKARKRELIAEAKDNLSNW